MDWYRPPVSSSSFPAGGSRRTSSRFESEEEDDPFEIVLPPSARFHNSRTSRFEGPTSPLPPGSSSAAPGSGRGRSAGRVQDLDHIATSSRRSTSVASERLRISSPYTSSTSDVGYSTDVHQCLYYVYGFLVPRSSSTSTLPSSSSATQPMASIPLTSPTSQSFQPEGQLVNPPPPSSTLSLEQCLQILGFSQSAGATPTVNVDKEAVISFFTRISSKQIPGSLSDLTDGNPFSLTTRFNLHAEMLRVPYTPTTGYAPEGQTSYMYIILSLQDDSCRWLIGTPAAPAAMYICRLMAQKARVMNIVEMAQQLVYRAVPFRTLAIARDALVPPLSRPQPTIDIPQYISPLSTHSQAPSSPHRPSHPHPQGLYHPISPPVPALPPPSRPLSSSSNSSSIVPGVTTGTTLLPNHRFTVEDFDAAMQRAKRVISQPRGRAALLAGGIISRIAKHCLGHANMDAVCQGPSSEGMALMQQQQQQHVQTIGVTSPGTSFLQYHQQPPQSGGSGGSGGAGTTTQGVLVLPCPDRPGFNFWDDDLTEEEVATIVGTYRVSTGVGGSGAVNRSGSGEGGVVTGGGQVAIRSWFPSPVLWHNMRACDLYFLEWTQEAEVFFVGRLEEIMVRGGQPLTQTEWRKRLHRFSPARNVHAAMDAFTRDFIGQRCQQHGVAGTR